MDSLNSLHFLHPEWFWLLLLLPLLWGLRFLHRQQVGQWEQWVDPQLQPFVLSGQQGKRNLWVTVVLSIALLVGIVAMAGPAWEKRDVPVFRSQQPVVIGMDFSFSMLANDENPNRLTLARFKLLDILQARQDAQNALLVFAGDAFTVTPLSDDIDTIQEQVKNLSPAIMPAQGSLLTPAIKQAAELLKQAGLGSGNILLVTDGVADSVQALVAAERAYQAGYRVSILAVGSPDGVPIELEQGRFLEDRYGKTVIAKVNLDKLKEVAEAGGGLFVRAALGDQDINHLAKLWQPSQGDELLTNEDSKQVDVWVNEGYWLVLLLLPLAALVFRRGWLGAVALGIILLPQAETSYAFGWNDLWQTPNQQGQAALQAGDAERARTLFTDPNWQGAAAYRQGDFAAAEQLYQANQDAVGQYNYANALARQGKLAEAVSAYENALQQQPEFADATENLRIVREALQQQEQQGDQQQQSDDQQQNAENNAQQDQDNAESESNGQQDAQQQQQNAEQNDAGSQSQQAQQQANAAEQQAAPEPEEGEQFGRPEDEQQAEQQSQQETQTADAQQREQEQAAEQWLRRIPDDPAGLWRRKFLNQYQQRSRSTEVDGW